MRLLLDTHAFLWWVADDAALSRAARKAISDPSNECLVSAASAWEMAIKVSIGKLSLGSDVRRFLPEQLAANGFEALPVSVAHATRVAALPFHHRDPFDRLLAAQALEERVPIVSADAIFRRYGVRRIW
ncbi:MAG TPA: type II toxin-antitoxin system VapC family toxin [Anaeromyxobacteraceae bacterium]|nr:type II toxin-antitoxin system VapC family toxin [Anaeromyxobacteraceae bacterium]